MYHKMFKYEPIADQLLFIEIEYSRRNIINKQILKVKTLETENFFHIPKSLQLI